MGIKYFYTFDIFRRKNFFARRISNFFGLLNEFKFILSKSLFKSDRLKYLIYYPSGSFISLVYYSLVSKILNLKFIVHYVEYRSEFVKRKNRSIKSFNDYFFDNSIHFFADSVVCISDFLLSRLIDKVNVIKIPAITDFSRFEIKKSQNIPNSEKYFFYCGSAGYDETLKFIIDSYSILDKPNVNLILKLMGSKSQIKQISNYCDLSKNNKSIIIIHKFLSTEDMNELTTNAIAVLIPIRNSIRDIARFPHKIAEYVASSSPIITTNFGEIKNYFKNMDTAFITNDYCIKSYSDTLKYVMNNQKQAKLIGDNAKKKCKQFFDYNHISKTLADFISNA